MTARPEFYQEMTPTPFPEEMTPTPFPATPFPVVAADDIGESLNGIPGHLPSLVVLTGIG